MEERLLAETAWLAQGVERTIAAAPTEYFGWAAVLRKCPKQRLGVDSVRLEVLKGFLRGWASHAHTHSAALREMLALIERDGRKLLAASAAAGLGLAGSPK
jgi:hypothetical protein